VKQYAIVKDKISGKLFGLVVRDEVAETCYGLSAKGEAWAEAYNDIQTKSIEDELPYGIEVGAFRGLSASEEPLLAEMIDGNLDVRLPNRDDMVHVASFKTRANTKILDMSGVPLSFFPDEHFQTAVEFKVRSLLNETARSSVMAKVRVDGLGIETKGMRFKSRDNNPHLGSDLSNMANGTGILRRTVKEVLKAKSESLLNHGGYSLSPFEPEVKALGPKVGGGLRSAPRGMSFVDITGRVDGDSDGIVFEGVPGMERPIIPRFTVPKNMARRVSALVDGDSMEIEKERRAGNPAAALDENRLRELLGDQSSLVRRIDGSSIQGRRSERRQRDDGKIGSLGLTAEQEARRGAGVRAETARRRRDDPTNLGLPEKYGDNLPGDLPFDEIEKLAAAAAAGIRRSLAEMEADEARDPNRPLLTGAELERWVREQPLLAGGMRSQRLSRSDGQVKRDSKGNIIPEDPERIKRMADRREERLRELGFDDDQIAQLYSGLRSRRTLDDIAPEEMDAYISATDERLAELRDELGIDPSTEIENQWFPQKWEKWVDNNFDGDYRDGMVVADELRRQRALQRDLRGRRSTQQRESDNIFPHNRNVDYMRRTAERDGFDPDETEMVFDEVLENVREFYGEFPGEILQNANNYTPARRRTGWDAQLPGEDETVRGRITKGPLKGARYEYFREASWGNRGDYGGGHHSLFVETPSGNTYEFGGGVEDSLGLESIRKSKGMRPSKERATGKEVRELLDGVDVNFGGYAQMNNGISSAVVEAATVLDGKGVYGSNAEFMGRLRAALRQLELDGPLDGMSNSDRSSLSQILNDTLDTLTERRSSSISGLQSRRGPKKPKAPKSPKNPTSGNPSNVSSEKLPKITDTSNKRTVELYFGLNGEAKRPQHKRIEAGDQNFFKMLEANGFVLHDAGGNGSVIIVPDRLYDWTKKQGTDVTSTWPGPNSPKFEEKIGVGILFRGTHWNPRKPLKHDVERWIRRIWGSDAIVDLERNAKKNGKDRGVGKVGKVDSIPPKDPSGNGMRSARQAAPRFSPDRGIDRADRQAAQMDVTATRGLGGGMRSRKKRGGVAGITKVNDRDGQVWGNLNDAQKASVRDAARAREGALFYDLTKNGPLDGARQNMLDDGLYTVGMTPDEMRQIVPENDLLETLQSALDSSLGDGEITPEVYASKRKQLDDIKTLAEMRLRGDYSMLEHLHDTTQKRVMTDARKENKDVPTAASVGLGQESTFYNDERSSSASAVGGAISERAAKKAGKRRRDFADRIMQPDADREQRRQNRRMRRNSLLGRTATQSDIAATEKARRKLARLLRRARRKLRGERTEKSIRKLFEDRRQKTPLARDAGGKPKVDDNFIDFLAFVQTRIIGRDKGEIDKETFDDLLLNLWENGEMNGKPVLLSENEFETLIDAGWTPIHRGVGRENSKALGYINSYKEDDDRFIPGQGARAYGVGEYWASEKSSHWGAYGTGMVGFVDPDGNGIDSKDLNDIQNDHKKLAREVESLISEQGTDVLKNEDPANAAAAITKRLKEAETRLGVAGLLEQSDMGRIYDQWIDQYSKLKPDDPRREPMWDALGYMQSLSAHDAGYYAPMLGYDYVDHGEVVLVHNRGTVAVLDISQPIDGIEARVMIKAARG